VIRCQICGAHNTESSAVCDRCGAALDASLTMSMAESPAARPVSSHPPQGGFVPGTLIADRYRVMALLGRGGMGEVYGADDLKLGQRVALKFLPVERVQSASWREQFYT